MSDLLDRFSTVIVRRLIEAQAIEVDAQAAPVVVARVAETLRGADRQSLVSTLRDALLACPDVIDVYCTDDELKEHIESLGAAWMRG